MAQQYIGKCQCGAVNYILLSSPKTTYACHCFDCQNVQAVRLGYQ